MLSEEKIIELYRSYGKELYYYIYRFLGSPDHAEDILQSCFERLIRFSQTNTIQMETMRGFLYRTAHNLCINHLKKDSRIAPVPIEDHINLKSDTDICGESEQKELQAKIYEYLDTLDELSKSVFILKKDHGLSAQEIAKITGKSERTVRRKIQQTTEQIMRYLQNCGFLTLFLAVIQLTGVLIYKWL